VPSVPAPRRVTVEAERLAGWLDRFAGKHGAVTSEVGPDAVVMRAEDGSLAKLTVPFPPLVGTGATYGGIVEHALRDRRVGVLLVRLGGFAAGVFDGTTLVSSKVGSRQVHGRSAAGGWSQQRFARRRENQAREAYDAASGHVHAILLPHADALDMLALAGDRAGVEAALDHRALAPLRDLPQRWLPGVPDPNRAVLADALAGVRSVEIAVYDATR
jgi:hypothetical protein